MSKVTASQSKPFAVQDGKPTSRPDLLKRINELHQQVSSSRISRPQDSFTTQELAAECGYSQTTARRKIKQLVAAGKVRRVGNSSSPLSYYVLTDENQPKVVSK